ncbi:Clavaminate synthase-like protein [Dioscorea alata]|uniref:Clavaminate synthase-like protein n=1 Tax=Dioscorea alata TaxID=55571 RepID=A0ACB7UZY6_DIOAL|nr:Clavaminate synthase-like protein [Dioscorea alata]
MPSEPMNKKRRRKRRSNPSPPLPSSSPSSEQQEEEEEEVGLVGFHLKPSASSKSHTIQPLGNLLLLSGSSSNARDPGLGSLRPLPDDLLLDILTLLPAPDLARLAAVSKPFYVFSTHDPLWRNLVLRDLGGDFLFNGSWRSTYSGLVFPHPSISIRDFYSDYLFQSWLCANLDMRPEWLRTDNIDRRRGISVDEFIARFEEPNRPVLLEGCIDAWPAMAKWAPDWLIRTCGDKRFAVGPVKMTMERYFRYAAAAREERPLYLFDPRFAEKAPELGSDYEVPTFFREDLFGVLGEQRPDYRWIIIGPAGSGSSFHVDPNSTSAWNAVIKGSKKWVMFPPEVVPPGVHPSPDGAEVACPVSIMEWFMNFYSACRTWKKRPVECVCKAGEVVFVPNGWWHLVINLEDSIAITQNFVSRRNLLNVLDFLKKPNASELVSGTKDRTSLHDKFKNAIEAAYPGTIDELTLKAKEKIAREKKPTFWESVADANVGGFKFSF